MKMNKIYLNTNTEIINQMSEVEDGHLCDRLSDFILPYNSDIVIEIEELGYEVVLDSNYRNWIGGKHIQQGAVWGNLWCSHFVDIPSRDEKDIDTLLDKLMEKAQDSLAQSDLCPVYEASVNRTNERI